MTYTYKELQEISATKRATPNRQYTQDNGDVYVGVIGGKLKKMENSNNVVVNNTNLSVSEALSSSDSDINNIMMELQSDSLLGYTTFTYDGNGNIIQKVVYLYSNLTEAKFVVDYTYNGDDLTQINVKRLTDNAVYKKILTYDTNGNVINKNIVQ